MKTKRRTKRQLTAQAKKQYLRKVSQRIALIHQLMIFQNDRDVTGA